MKRRGEARHVGIEGGDGGDMQTGLGDDNVRIWPASSKAGRLSLGLESSYGVLPLSRFSFYRSQRGVYNVGFPSGLSVVELIAAGQNVLDVKGLDDLDGVPLLDVQPYFPSIDESPVARRGRLEHKLGKERS